MTDEGLDAFAFTEEEVAEREEDGDGIVFMMPSEPGDFPEEEYVEPEPVEDATIGETFEAQGFEWTITGLDVQQERENIEMYTDEIMQGPFLMLSAEITNVTEEYISPSNPGIMLYTDQTTHPVSSTVSTTLYDEENIVHGDLAPGASSSGYLVMDMASPNEEPLHVEFQGQDGFDGPVEARLNLE